MKRGVLMTGGKLRQMLRKLPNWLKITVSVIGVLAFLVGVVSVFNASTIRLKASTDFPLKPRAPELVSPEISKFSSSTTLEESVAIARTALDTSASDTGINIFDAYGDRRNVDSAEAPEVAAAAEAFSEAGFSVGFVVYDFTTERGLDYNADSNFFSASTIKAPYVAYLAQAVIDAGQAALTDEIEEVIIEEGTGVMAFDDVATYDLQTALYNTVVYSDNTGYALLRNKYDSEFESWVAQAGVDTSSWIGEWYPYLTPRDLAKLWLDVGGYLKSEEGMSALCGEWFAKTETSFIRKALGPARVVLAKPGYEIDTPWYDMGALNDAGIVQEPLGDYLLVVMSDADYDDEFYTEAEPLITDLIAALDAARIRLLIA